MCKYRYNDDEFEVLVDKKMFIYNKKNSKYYVTEINKEWLLENKKKLKPYVSKVNKITSYILGIVFMVLFIINIMIFMNLDFKPIKNEAQYILVLVLTLIINIVLHEYSHVKSLNFFGQKHNKIGFQLIKFIIPAIYVEMSNVYLIGKIEKIIVYLSGVFVNFVIMILFFVINFMYLKNTDFNSIWMWVELLIIYNLIPLFDSDGYKVILCFFDEYDYKKKKTKIIKYLNFLGIVLISVNILLVINKIFAF